MIDSLIEYIMSFWGVTTLFIIALVILFMSTIPERHDKPKLASCMRFIPIFIMTIPLWVGLIELRTPPKVTTTEWRTVYTNNIDAQVSLHISPSSPFRSAFDVQAGQELGDDYEEFERGQGSITVVAAKNGTTVRKDAYLWRENITINGQLSKHSKIEKIEYREVTKQYKHHTSESNEIRVTIDGTKTTGDEEELEGLFK